MSVFLQYILLIYGQSQNVVNKPGKSKHNWPLNSKTFDVVMHWWKVNNFDTHGKWTIVCGMWTGLGEKQIGLVESGPVWVDSGPIWAESGPVWVTWAESARVWVGSG